MNTTLWLAVFAALLAPMVSAGDFEKSTLTELDIASIEREAATLVARLNAPSPTETQLQQIGDLQDKLQELRGNSPTSPKLKAQFEDAVNKVVLSPLVLTRAISSSSPKFKPQAIKAN